MKTTVLTLFFAASGLLFGGLSEWTSSDGRRAEMELLSVTEKDGEKVGKFRLRGGRILEIPASKLSEESAKRFDEFKSKGLGPAPKNAFEGLFAGNLLRLEGKSLLAFDEIPKPKKYFVFYYTASWCGPCQRFTPSLVEWYEKNKNENFELVLISSDSKEEAMESYAASKKMPWPQLKLRKANEFKTTFPHGVTGIPSLILCDLDGKNLGNFRGDLPALTKRVSE